LCIGKNISTAEIFKVLIEILRTFELQLVDPESSLKIHGNFFVTQTGFNVYLKKRQNVLYLSRNVSLFIIVLYQFQILFH
jgi:hypothetical protein